jgi:hypothetical protein
MEMAADLRHWYIYLGSELHARIIEKKIAFLAGRSHKSRKLREGHKNENKQFNFFNLKNSFIFLQLFFNLGILDGRNISSAERKKNETKRLNPTK